MRLNRPVTASALIVLAIVFVVLVVLGKNITVVARRPWSLLGKDDKTESVTDLDSIGRNDPEVHQMLHNQLEGPFSTKPYLIKYT